MKCHQAELALEEVERRRPHVPQRDGRQANQPCVQLGEQVHKDFFVKKIILHLLPVLGIPDIADPYLWLMDPDPTSDPTHFYSDFKVAKNIIFFSLQY